MMRIFVKQFKFLIFLIKFTMLMGIAIEIPFSLGEAVLGLEAYLIRDWKILQIVAYLPMACKPLLLVL